MVTNKYGEPDIDNGRNVYYYEEREVLLWTN